MCGPLTMSRAEREELARELDADLDSIRNYRP
jgi:hypothetical protein